MPMTQVSTVGTPATIGAFAARMTAAGLPFFGYHKFAESPPPTVLIFPTLSSGLLSPAEITPDKYYLTAPGFRDHLPELHRMIRDAHMHFPRIANASAEDIGDEFIDMGARLSGSAAADVFFMSAAYYSLSVHSTVRDQKAPGALYNAASSLKDVIDGSLRRAILLDAAYSMMPTGVCGSVCNEMARYWLDAARWTDDRPIDDRFWGRRIVPEYEAARDDMLSRAIRHASADGFCTKPDHGTVALAYRELVYDAAYSYSEVPGFMSGVDEAFGRMALAALNVLQMPREGFTARHRDILLVMTHILSGPPAGRIKGGRKLAEKLEAASRRRLGGNV